MNNSNKENMEAAKKIIEAFKNQTKIIQPTNNFEISTEDKNLIDNQGDIFAQPGVGNSIGIGFDNQGSPDKRFKIEESVPISVPKNSSTITNSPTSPISSQGANNICPECNMIHPPLKPGQKCPNVNIGKTIKHRSNLTDEIINKHLVDIRNIIISNIDSKEIEDSEKFFQYAVIELTKALETYHE